MNDEEILELEQEYYDEMFQELYEAEIEDFLRGDYE